ncbi:hypothetical protein LTR56_016772 [Elasticomyces elasticus]|nr:hypothetical protein LTR56_016772 [Elasticomyces elasticus]KAK3644893.1 hypothetical protein LTR22_015039 [Elasticomyces elasticus]KAK4923362.1 hypothetical protein LTR49_009432 [Elasticomyces elasticus]KAK5753267.1 hypothetical protein LTS12_016603 [Elasticomyces elasticus]
MSDITQWRRMIQPGRTRTPAVEAADDSDGMASPTTPRRGLKPKFSAYFNNGYTVKTEPSFLSLNEDPFSPQLPAWLEEQPYQHPDAERLIDSIMCRLMSDPYGSLDSRFNSMLLHIFESYRGVLDEKQQLQEQLTQELHGKRALVHKLQQAQKQWFDERQEYRDEIKRLELLLAKGKRGLAEVTLARQDSHFRQRESWRRSDVPDDGLRAIFDVLERTQRSDEKRYGGQRAVLRPRKFSSPSERDRRLSQHLTMQGSARGPQADLAMDRVPAELQDTGMQLPAVSSEWPLLSEPKTSMSDDTFSTFSNDAKELAADGGARARLDTVEKPTTTLHKTPSLMSKASGFFHKLRPHAVSELDSRFSFLTGDDLTLNLQRSKDASSRGTSLRRSMSLTSLSGKATVKGLSPIVQSPTTSTTFSDTSRTSRIPMPTYSGSSIVRPRREREGSADDQLPGFESKPMLRRNRVEKQKPVDYIQGNAFAAAAAREVRVGISEPSNGSVHPSLTRKAPAQSDMSESMKENMPPPIAWLDDVVTSDAEGGAY